MALRLPQAHEDALRHDPRDEHDAAPDTVRTDTSRRCRMALCTAVAKRDARAGAYLEGRQ